VPVLVAGGVFVTVDDGRGVAVDVRVGVGLAGPRQSPQSDINFGLLSDIIL
jgi:hypothetical protein